MRNYTKSLVDFNGNGRSVIAPSRDDFHEIDQGVRFVYGLLPATERHSSELRRVCIFGFSLETLSPSPQVIRTPVPQWVNGLKGLKADQVLPEQISLSDSGLSLTYS
jgi:hypothetical protein